MKKVLIFITVFIVCFLISVGIICLYDNLRGTALELNNPNDIKNNTYYKVDMYIEENVIFDEYSIPSEPSGYDYYYALPCSITINGEKYYSYVYLNTGAYSNYKENNKYSWNNQKGRSKHTTTDNKDAKAKFEAWCDQNGIDEEYRLKYGFDK